MPDNTSADITHPNSSIVVAVRSSHEEWGLEEGMGWLRVKQFKPEHCWWDQIRL